MSGGDGTNWSKILQISCKGLASDVCYGSNYSFISSLQRGLENLEGVISVSLEALLSSLPVDDLPDVLHVGSLAIKVLFVESAGHTANATT
jgi:hypothetical protein